MNTKPFYTNLKFTLAVLATTLTMLVLGPKAPADTAPNIPLSIMDVEILNLTSSKVSISWHCNVDCTGSWYLDTKPMGSVDQGAPFRSNAPGDGVQALHQFVIDNLTPGTDYYIKLKSSLPDGYSLISYNIKFSTAP